MGAGATRAEGERLGPYELVGLLGRGGMGEVWEAVLHGPAGFRKSVALKCLRAERLHDPDVLVALQREARLGARLQHPNVVGTWGLSEHDGTWVMALELVHGASLTEIVRAVGPLPGARVLDVGVQALAGLTHAHDHGLVHRDVKPGNVLVDRSGLIKVADLGISLLAGESGVACGTPGYMAPEQVGGLPGPRSDLFSIGVLLAALATGRRPFGRALPTEDVLADRSALQAVEAVVPGIASVLERCFAFDPADRWPDAATLGRELAALRSRQDPAAPLLELLARARPSLGIERTPSPLADDPTKRLGGNVPPRRDRFVGREEDLDKLRTRLAEGERLVVLRGVGGVGKTRLAVEVARSVSPSLPGGAWLVDLSEARTPEDVCRFLAAALDVRVGAGRAVEQLGRALAAQARSLFVFDNLESCIQHLPGTLGVWVDAAPEAAFLGTSRVDIRLRGVQEVQVAPLAPDAAAALFVARAPRALAEREQDALAPLCEALDGLPLAVELAAARSKLLDVGGIRDRLSPRLLADGGPDRPARQRSMAASLDWSLELLSEPAAAALAQLTVFEGGWTLDAAEAVLDVPGAVDALFLLDELVDASLLRVDAQAHRFGMLGLVQSHAAARLSNEQRYAAERRHAQHFAQHGSVGSVRALLGPEGWQRRGRLADDIDNLVRACHRAVEDGDGPAGADLLRALWTVAQLRGPLSVAAELSAALLQVPELDPGVRASAHNVAGLALSSTGRVSEAEAQLDAALAIRRAEGQLAQQGMLVGNLAILYIRQHRLDEALDAFDRALAIHRQVGNRSAEGTVLGNLGILADLQGDRQAARAYLEQSLIAHREVGNLVEEGIGLSNLGAMAYKDGQLKEAASRLASGLAIHERVGNPRTAASVRANLGSVCFDLGAVEQAREHFETSLRLHRRVGDAGAVGAALGRLGRLAQVDGDPGAAAALYDQARTALRRAHHRAGEGAVIYHLALLAGEQGDLAEARAGLEAALSIGEEVADPSLEGAALAGLGRSWLQTGDLQSARMFVDRAEGVLRVANVRDALARTLILRAELEVAEGGRSRAVATVDEAEQVAPVGHAELHGLIADLRVQVSDVRT